jgi:beta-glucosidase
MGFLGFFFILFVVYVIMTVVLRPYYQKRFAPALAKTSPEIEKNIIKELDFGEKFEFGTATAAWQVENIRNPSNWSSFENPKPTKSKADLKVENSKECPPQGEGCCHYENFNEDVELMKKMNMKVYRFGLSWSDIEPAKDLFDDDAINRYVEMVDILTKNGITPMVTLWHFEHPEWLEAEGGVLSGNFEERYAKYVEKVVDSLKNVKFWFTVNEPNIYGILTHLLCSFPCVNAGFSITKTLETIQVLLKCHVCGYNIIHEKLGEEAKVSFAINVQPFLPEHKYSLIETQIAEVVNQFNYVVFDAIETGVAKFTFAGIKVIERPVCSGKIKQDFISINHYNYQWITLNWKHWDAGIPLLSMQGHIYETSDFKWCVAYDSLANTVRWVNDKFNPDHLDIVISENGISDESDKLRKKHIQLTLLYLKNAMEKYSIPVTTYIHWSLLDNYEWAYGYEQHFGLIGIETDVNAAEVRKNKKADGQTNYKRVPRQSAEIYMKIAALSLKKKTE